jgi:apolipoprotein D and lipocalin family protein
MAFSLFSCKTVDLPTVDKVDLDRYTGHWHEIARLPASFQKDCSCTTADYALKENYVEVVNRCYDVESAKWKESKGKAKVVSGSGNSRLKVSFFWPFYGDYYIIALDKDYQYAMVGTPSRKYLWILAREKNLDEQVKNELIKKAKELGFDTSQLIFNAFECNS